MASARNLQPTRGNRAPFTSSYRRDELCYCTEELGSESISYRGAIQASVSAAHSPQRRYDERNVLLPETDEEKCTALQRAGLIIPCTGAGKCSHLYDRYELSSCQALSSSSSCTPGRKLSLTHAHTFPPPLSSLLSERPIMRSFKSNGRFVLQIVNTISGSPFRSVRQNGRLKLYFSDLDKGESETDLLAVEIESCCDILYQDSMNEEDEKQNIMVSNGVLQSTDEAVIEDSEVSEEIDEDKDLEEAKLSLSQPTLHTVPGSVTLFGMTCNLGPARAQYDPCGLYLPALRLLLVKAKGLSKRAAASHDGRLDVGQQPLLRRASTLQQAAVVTESEEIERQQLVQELDSMSSCLNMGDTATQLMSPTASYTANVSAGATDDEVQLPLHAVANNAMSANLPTSLAERRPAYALISVSFNSHVQLFVVLETTSAGSVMIKDIHFLSDCKAAGAAPAANSTNITSTRGESCALLYTGESQAFCIESFNKPMDFRIAA